VGSLVAAGYEVYTINLMSVARYRERHSTSGAKSDPGDAATLAELARTDRHHDGRIAGDSDLAEAVRCWPEPIIRAWLDPPATAQRAAFHSSRALPGRPRAGRTARFRRHGRAGWRPHPPVRVESCRARASRRRGCEANRRHELSAYPTTNND
jgi:hypothetical protein